MAKIVLDHMFRSVRGKVGGYVYYQWKGINCCRAYVRPRNPDTAAQRRIRERLAEASASWRGLPLEVRERFNYRASESGLRMSGFNLYVACCMKGDVISADDMTKSGSGQLMNYPQFVTGNDPVPLRISFVFYPGIKKRCEGGGGFT